MNNGRPFLQLCICTYEYDLVQVPFDYVASIQHGVLYMLNLDPNGSRPASCSPSSWTTYRITSKAIIYREINKRTVKGQRHIFVVHCCLLRDELLSVIALLCRTETSYPLHLLFPASLIHYVEYYLLGSSHSGIPAINYQRWRNERADSRACPSHSSSFNQLRRLCCFQLLFSITWAKLNISRVI